VVVLATPWARDRDYLRPILQHHGIRIIEAITYREALSAAGRYGATAVLCDETLAWRDLLSHLAVCCEPPRLVVISAAPSRTLCAEVMNLGGFDVLNKPFEDKDVAWILNMACSVSTVHAVEPTDAADAEVEHTRALAAPVA
jgi:DNA-binding response OmpR family regulator